MSFVNTRTGERANSRGHDNIVRSHKKVVLPPRENTLNPRMSIRTKRNILSQSGRHLRSDCMVGALDLVTALRDLQISLAF